MKDDSRTFAGRVAAVTGAGSGIGRAVALGLASAGAQVAAIDLSDDGLQATAAMAPAGSIRIMVQDVSRAGELGQLMGQIEGELGRLDHVVSAAGVVAVMPFMELTPEAWERLFAVNVTGTFFTLQAAARVMVAAGRGGSMVSLASLAGRLGRPQYSHYAASKAAVISLSRSAAAALAPSIRVNCVCPGIIATPMWEQLDRESAMRFDRASGETFERAVAEAPLGRAGTPEEVSDLILYLLSDAARYITGQAIQVDGGIHMA
ncbi:MAG TPA: SDR family NAD(P)-dependent oxidoreductase [Candidatus Nitrosotalea sp.]|nr:SDR family NAD(P)-dependent oxidoreductase [Candidatus Nitrosotalea sp.]